jgi:hypothetical protein
MNINEAVERACQEPTLDDALSWICVWECERAIRQAKEFFETGISTASPGAGWDTCFHVCITEVRKRWAELQRHRFDPVNDELRLYTLDEWMETLCHEARHYAETMRGQNDFMKQPHTWNEWTATFGRYMSW